MKRFAILACTAALFAAGCGGTSTSPSNQPTVFTVALKATRNMLIIVIITAFRLLTNL